MKNETIRTALISVTDKTALDKIATVLKEHDIKILSSSGTKKYLADRGIETEEIDSHMDFEGDDFMGFLSRLAG